MAVRFQTYFAGRSQFIFQIKFSDKSIILNVIVAITEIPVKQQPVVQ